MAYAPPSAAAQQAAAADDRRGRASLISGDRERRSRLSGMALGNKQERPYIIYQALLIVPQNAIDIELCLRITSKTPTLHLLIWIMVVAPLFLPRLGLRLRPQVNGFIGSGLRRII